MAASTGSLQPAAIAAHIAMATAIVSHIQTFAVVTSNGATAPAAVGAPSAIVALPGTIA